MSLYLAAVAANNEASGTVADVKTEAWREATKDTREACQEALSDLNEHRKQHGLELPPYLTQPVSRNSTSNFRHGNELQIQ
jgi:hypothetical protein